MFIFRFLLLSFIVISIQTLVIPQDEQNVLRQAIEKKSTPLKISTTFIRAMYPVGDGEKSFNGRNNQEWEIQRESDTIFAIYGENLNNSHLSFTTHAESCIWERKDRIYLLQVNESNPNSHVGELAYVTLHLPFYNSTLYLCVTPPDSSRAFHQGNTPLLKLRVTRRALPVWATILFLICLLILSGLFSGLNLGLMSLTPHDLKVIQEAGTPNDQKYAKRIYPVRKHGNFLLCTILLGNVLVNSTTTILLDSLISGAMAVACATLTIVIFGEIMPQAICSRHGLKVGSQTVLLTKLFMLLTFPISYPLSKLLDTILGEEVGARYTRDQMGALLKHTTTTDIEDREKIMMTGVLSLKAKKIRGVMTNLEDVFMLEANRIVDDELVLNVYGYGYSRIPVYEGQKNNIIGLVYARDFALPDTDSGKFTVRNIMNFCKHRYGASITPDDSSYDVFNLFKKEQYHLGVVVEYDNTSEKDPRAKAIGIVTLEDIIEEMIQEEIVDETDVFTDNRRKVRNVLSQAQDFSVFIGHNSNEATSKISAQMKVAVFQFLSTSVEPFKEKYISPNILSLLLNADLYKEYEFNEDETKSGKTTYIYEYGKAVDYFVLIVNGNAELETGKEKIVSEIGSFYYFGASALYSSDEKIDDLIRSKSNKFRPFTPDFSLRVSETVQILRIRRVHWLAAVRATYFERKQTPNDNTSLLDSSGKKVDLLAQELEKVDNVDPVNATGSIAEEQTRQRTSSLALTVASDSGVDYEKILAEQSDKPDITNSNKILSNMTINSERNTPTLTEKRRKQLFRSSTTTAATPPSLTGGSPKY
ncbi:unnamed protein product [Adineta ricciae]|uniref:Metal transporter CNNM4 n=1 Tax=Adineta ricciae TaxID=249248 RepID=A0A815R208_ADIRI|nr:unnamed protein product [Adineta ricciae]